MSLDPWTFRNISSTGIVGGWFDKDFRQLITGPSASSKVIWTHVSYKNYKIIFIFYTRIPYNDSSKKIYKIILKFTIILRILLKRLQWIELKMIPMILMRQSPTVIFKDSYKKGCVYDWLDYPSIHLDVGVSKGDIHCIPLQ